MASQRKVIVSVDVEGEWFASPGEQTEFDVTILQKNLMHLEDALNIAADTLGMKIPITWFVRCDDSIKNVTGASNGLLHLLDKFIDRRMMLGDEFGLHPHLYSVSAGIWGSELNERLQYEQIIRSATAWEGYFGSLPILSRIGEAKMNNEIAKAINQLGISIDSTALPGRYRNDENFNFNWVGTPCEAYYPSLADYRLGSIDFDKRNKFLEVPFTMIKTKTSIDAQPYFRYFNLAFKNEIVRKYFKIEDLPEKIMCVIHPHELSGNKEHHIISYSSRSLVGNLRLMLSKSSNFQSLTQAYSDGK